MATALPLQLPRPKKPEEGSVLSGRADYVLNAGGRVPWVIEAKAAARAITDDDIEQAYSYAIHPEVRAVYFALCNGYELQVFQTNQGPGVSPLLRLSYTELETEDGHLRLRNLLSPDSVLRDNPLQMLDLAPPLGPSLRSTCRISGGAIEYDSLVPNVTAVREMVISIIGGSVERAHDGGLTISIESRSSVKSIDAFLKKCKLTVFDAKCEDSMLSTDPAVPNIFRTKANTIFPGGSRIMDPSSWKEVVLPTNIFAEMDFEAQVVLSGESIEGTVRLFARWNRQPLLKAEGRITIFLSPP